MFGIYLLLASLLGAFTSVESYCTTKLQCFKTELFNFNCPPPQLYPIQYITEQQDNDYGVVAYGDFNNDLWTDFASLVSDNNSLSLQVWDTDKSIFKEVATLQPDDCTIQAAFTYDADLNGLLDLTLWGINEQGKNCLVPYLQTKGMKFQMLTTRVMEPTSQPFVISYGSDNGRDKTNALCIFQNGTRTILKLDSSAQGGYIPVEWNFVFNSDKSKDYSGVPFADPHWNSYLDLTGDCRSDVVVVDDAGNIEIWVSQGKTFTYQSSLTSENAIQSLFFADMDYSGTPDIILTYSNKVLVYFNTRAAASTADFCCEKCTSVSFQGIGSNGHINDTLQSSAGMVLNMKDDETIVGGPSHVADVDIDGYPDLFLILQKDQTIQFTRLYTNRQGSKFGITGSYQLDFNTTNQIKFISFIDFLENGILDFLITVQQEDGNMSTQAYVNNYVQQNSFYIKGYAASGENSSMGCQTVGATFLWVNSLGDKLRMAYNTQIAQTAYSALQLPFAYCGLGRANNYVESFTIGVMGQTRQWSPIIPNSQLAVYAPSSDVSDWQIRIFVLPTDSLVYVMIVCIILLFILGSVLLILKCKYYKKKEEPLMEFLH